MRSTYKKVYVSIICKGDEFLGYIIENIWGYIIIWLVIYLGINAFVAIKFESIANMKGHTSADMIGHTEYFWWCFWLGAIGWAMVIALPDRNQQVPIRPRVPGKIC